MANKSKGTKRYNLVIPEDLFNEVKDVAEKQGTTTVEVIRKFIRIGLLAEKTQGDPGSALIIREGDTEKQILIF